MNIAKSLCLALGLALAAGTVHAQEITLRSADIHPRSEFDHTLTPHIPARTTAVAGPAAGRSLANLRAAGSCSRLECPNPRRQGLPNRRNRKVTHVPPN